MCKMETKTRLVVDKAKFIPTSDQEVHRAALNTSQGGSRPLFYPKFSREEDSNHKKKEDECQLIQRKIKCILYLKTLKSTLTPVVTVVIDITYGKGVMSRLICPSQDLFTDKILGNKAAKRIKKIISPHEGAG